jgi:hypothetical protein
MSDELHSEFDKTFHLLNDALPPKFPVPARERARVRGHYQRVTLTFAGDGRVQSSIFIV